MGIKFLNCLSNDFSSQEGENVETQYSVCNSDQKEELSGKVNIVVVFGECYHVILEFTQQSKYQA